VDHPAADQAADILFHEVVGGGDELADIFPGIDRLDAGRGLRSRDVDRAYPRMGVR
jgi:hypothetical protein